MRTIKEGKILCAWFVGKLLYCNKCEAVYELEPIDWSSSFISISDGEVFLNCPNCAKSIHLKKDESEDSE